MAAPAASPPRTVHPLELLLELIRRARAADGADSLRFIAVNDTHLLVPYQQAALWLREEQLVAALSGLVEVERNAPYVRWVQAVAEHHAEAPARILQPSDLPPALAADWEQWLPAHAVWVPFGRALGRPAAGGMLLARVPPWRELDLRLLSEWLDTWSCIHAAVAQPTNRLRFSRFCRAVRRSMRRHPILLTVAAVATLAFPVRLSVLAPGELVPAHPIAIRAPLDGVIKAFHVSSNERVNAQQPLFSYEDVHLSSRLEVAEEARRTAEAEHRQLSQQALQDPRARAALAATRGQLEERRLEVEYLRDQLTRTQVLAPRDGVAFVSDPAEWIGRPVVTGERILRLAEPGDKEVEAWLPVRDAIALHPQSPVRLYLNSSPLSPVSAYVETVAYEATRRPDGSYAYRVRARVDPTDHRVGLKGTVRLEGDRVPMIYWMLRRPLAAAREWLGW